MTEGTVTSPLQGLRSSIADLVTHMKSGVVPVPGTGVEASADRRRYGPAIGMFLAALLAFALTGLPRLSASLVEYFNTSGAEESVFEKRPLFLDKLSVSQYTLARPDDSASPWSEIVEREDDAPSAATSAPAKPPRWKRSLVTAAFWHHTNFV